MPGSQGKTANATYCYVTRRIPNVFVYRPTTNRWPDHVSRFQVTEFQNTTLGMLCATRILWD